MVPTADGRARKSRGAFYTPPHVVAFILDATLGRLLAARPADESAPLRLLDPSCGSGAFLEAACRRLLAHGAGPGGAPSSARVRIVRECLFGVDLDPAAVDECRRRLRAAVAAPDDPPALLDALDAALQRNVRCGDALLPPRSPLDPATDPSAAPAPFDWSDPATGFGDILAAGGFDAVVGNPPYLNVKRGQLDRDALGRLAERFRTAAGACDAFAMFGELALRLLRPGGFHGFVLPRPVLASESYRTLRELYYAAGVTDLAECGAPFPGAAVESVAIVVRQDHPPARVRVAALDASGGSRALAETPYAAFGSLPDRNFSSRLTPDVLRVLRRLETAPLRLGDAAATLARGLECGKRDRAVRPFGEDIALRPLVRGQDVHRYRIADTDVGFDPSDAEPATLKDPETYDASPKIMLRRVAPAIVAALDTDRRWALNAVYLLVPRPEVPVRALLGVLNSAIPSFWLRTVFLTDDRIFPYLRLSQLRRVPLPDLAAIPAAERTALEDLVDRRTAAADDATAADFDHRIDDVVAGLYGWGEDERRTVLGR